MKADRKAGALPLAAKPLTPGYFHQNEVTKAAFILAQVSPPEAHASYERAVLIQRTSP